MNDSRIMLRGPVAVAAAIALVAVGAGATYLLTQRPPGQPKEGIAGSPTNRPSNPPNLPLPDVVVTLSKRQ